MSKIKDLGLNLVPTRLPKKNIVETAKAEEIATKIHSPVVEPPVQSTEPVVPDSEPILTEKSEIITKPETEQPKSTPKSAIPKNTNKTKESNQLVKSTIKKRVARTLIEDPNAVRKTSFDFPVALYRAMKIRLAEDGVSMRDYVIGLIEDDLNSR
ncbi:MAG: hypothetical protein JNL70_22405 [Saprospiraceae bacterium]|nr:hypothetical protein [Saprospiraceae bacterium]